MNRLLSILLLFCVYSHLYAQPLYDSFSPATSRPILDVVQNLDAYQPRTLYDIMSGGMNLYWDANGNIAEMIHCEQDAGRFHEWDEDNRLRFVLGERFAGYYGYDANGERVYKLMGTCGIDQINHNGTRAYVMFDDAVLYPNPYLVVTPRGYTKHYYAGTERLATAIGSGGFDDMGLTIGHYDSREEDIAQMFYANYQNEDPFYYDHILSEMIGTSTIEGDNMPELEYRREPIILGRVDVIGGENLLYSSIEDNLPVRDRERELFFSHSDHLGSANWITDYDGVPIQYLHYAPYGELVENQRVTDYDERYKFTGKERDWETGYDFFGARYWWLAGTWLSVDPLADKYPNISPYAYCMWNPVNYIDPDGKWSVSVHAFSDRAKSPYAVYKVHNRRGDVVWQTVVKVKGWRGSKYRNRKITNGDTPTGLYRMNKWRKSEDPRYGTNDFMDQDYLEGEGKGPGTDNRNRMHTHGGGDVLNEIGELVDLKGTSGCIRMADEDMKEMKSITDALQDFDPQEKMTNLTVSNDLEEPIGNFSQSRKEVKNGNGGFWLPEIEVTP